MRQKETFTRINVAEIKRNRMIDELLANLEGDIQKEAEQLAQELVNSGYNVDDFEIELDTEVKGEKYFVTMKVVQVGKHIEYDLAGKTP